MSLLARPNSSSRRLYSNLPRDFTTILRNYISRAGTETNQSSLPNVEGDRRIQRTRRDGAGSPPNPIPNRPLRGDRPPSRNDGNNNSNGIRNRRTEAQRNHPKLDLGSDDDTPLVHTNPAGESFLEKFKLGFEGKEKGPTTNNSGCEPEEASSPPQDSDEIFKKMKETGLIPNAVAMLDGLCKDGLVQDAMKLFGLMRDKGTIPEVVIYTAVVDGFSKAHKFDDAKRIFRKMQTNGIPPNAFSYTILIQGLCRGRNLEDAADFCVEMLEAGHLPNVSTFTTLIDGFCKDKGVQEAESTVRRLREKGFFVNDKSVREHLDKNGPFSPLLWEAIFGKKISQKLF
ncbi:hypothetical protein IFM89_039549 [Coptis chinensis]|uniref:Pentatricopeptide repeat-containing protein n=1 Tax=Coptis chinensis TaxID=261450 RepID=A0A835GUY5_9MAGN|nr:hypothetical protein IFM89_039549 [Coptis chinensis]